MPRKMNTQSWRIVRRLLAPAVIAGLVAGCALPLVSESDIETESKDQFQKMQAQMPVSTDAGLRSYVNCVANAIIEQLPEPYASEDWNVVVFESDQVNAFAMPGGEIGVFTGILGVATTPDELATVVGHEVAHVTQKHALERANREATTNIGLIGANAVLGGGQATGSLLSMGAKLGLTLPYGRSQESEADTVGLKYMAAAGFNPRQSIDLWKNMDKNGKVGPAEFLSTHPASSTRIQDLIAQLPTALDTYNTAQASGKKPTCHR